LLKVRDWIEDREAGTLGGAPAMFESQQMNIWPMTPEMAPASAKPRGWSSARLFANHVPDKLG
jgi:hypothetical protein